MSKRYAIAIVASLVALTAGLGYTAPRPATLPDAPTAARATVSDLLPAQSARPDGAVERQDVLAATLIPAVSDGTVVDSAVARLSVQAVFGPNAAVGNPELAYYTSLDYGQIRSDQSFAPAYVNVLVWAFVTDAPMSAQGASGPVNADRTVTPGTTCHAALIADAHTGGYLTGYSACDVPRES